MRSSCNILSSVASSTLQHFSTLSPKRHDFLGKNEVIGHKMCVLIFSTNLSETYLILRGTKRDIIINVHDIFPHYLMNGTIFGKILLNIKMCVWIFFTTVKHFSFQEELREILS